MRQRRFLAVALCLPLLGCYEEPVRDHLHVAFAPGAAIIVTAVRTIAPPSAAGDNRALEARMEQARSDLAGGWDRWSRGFTELDPVADRTTVERHGGEARRGIHSALVDSFRPLERLLANEGLGAFYDQASDIRELQLFPTGSGQATRQQRDLVDQVLAEWSSDVAAYLQAATAMYEYLDEVPGRAVPCFAHVFDRHTEQSGPLDDREGELVTEVKRTCENVADILLIVPDQAYSVNELSRLAFDAFQGRLTIAVDGPIVELEGLVDRDDFLERPPVDLWRALESVAKRWLVPDLVTAMVSPKPEDPRHELDPAAFATLPRHWTPPPDAATVEAAIRARLQPLSVYRVRWQTQPGLDDDDEALERALALLANAEQDLPD